MADPAPAFDRSNARVRFALIAALALEMLAVDFLIVQALLKLQPWGTDFLPMWTAARDVWRGDGHRLYDFAAISREQDWLLGPVHKVRPWAYPPSALLVLAPFGLAGFWVSLSVWCLATTAAGAWATSKAAPQVPALALFLASPALTLVLICGQVTLLVGALSLMALVWLERRPWFAGALIGMALALKPSSLVLLPVALVAARAWRPLFAAAAVGAALAAASAALLGLECWTAWLASLPRFQALVMADASLVARMVSPAALARWVGLGGTQLLALQALLAVGAAALIWVVFSRRRDPVARQVALLGGGLIAAPYAMQYESALLAAPAAILVARAGSVRALMLSASAYLVLAVGILPPLGALTTSAFTLFVCAAALLRVTAAPERTPLS